ncbi:thiaminase II [Phyllobacteriaceae bacterium JZ32]
MNVLSSVRTDFSSPVFAAWREAAGDDWTAYIDHEFVRRLGDGSLPRASFIHYLIQDYVFLRHFARAWALAVVKANSREEMRIAASTVDALVNHELPLHVGICAEEGISEDELFVAEEAPENLAYTRFVLDAGHSGDFLDLMAVLAPCVMGYGEIGTRLAATAAADMPYRRWIDTYAGQDYQEVCHRAGQLIEQAARDRLGSTPRETERWRHLCRQFRIATRLEAAFWQMGLRGHA